MKSVGNRKPQLVGYNSAQADVPILVQRAIINGLPGFGFSGVQTNHGRGSITLIA